MLRLPAARPVALRRLRLTVPSLRSVLRSVSPRTRGRPARTFRFTRTPFRLSNGDGRISHVPGEPRYAHALLYGPRWDRARQTAYSGSMLPSVQCGRRRLPQLALFRGSITRPMHSLSTLRNAGRPDATQDSLPAVGQLCRAGAAACRVPTKGFMHSGYGPIMQSPFPKLRGAPAFGADAACVAGEIAVAGPAAAVRPSLPPIPPE